jgi:hypothetical protein
MHGSWTSHNDPWYLSIAFGNHKVSSHRSSLLDVINNLLVPGKVGYREEDRQKNIKKRKEKKWYLGNAAKF